MRSLIDSSGIITHVPDIIISGGQSGSDIGGLLGARAAGIATGGYAQKGLRTEYGQEPSLGSAFGLIASDGGYDVRTRLNVEMADAVVVVAYDMESPGTRLTLQLARNRPIYNVPFSPQLGGKLEPYMLIDDVRHWLRQVRPGILMVAGNRESRAKGIQRWTSEFIQRVFSLDTT